MPSEPPPSRYRVVERGRRLEVIDPLAGETATPAPPRSADALSPGAAITTHRWFDDKAPRRLALDPGAARWLDGARSVAIGAAVTLVIALALQPYLAILLVPLLDRRIRARLRGAATAWLDRLDPAG